MVECRICNREVAGSNLSLGYFAPRSTQPSIPPGSVNEYQLRLGRQRQVWLIPIVDERVGVQVKLWNPLRTRAIPERFWGGDSLRRGGISSVHTFTFIIFTLCLTISLHFNDFIEAKDDGSMVTTGAIQAQLMLTNPRNLSVKVSKHGTIRYVRYSFLLVYYSNFVRKFFQKFDIKNTATLKTRLGSVKVTENVATR